MPLYRYHEGIWTKHRAVNYGRISLKLTGVETTEPRRITHTSDVTQGRRQIELSEIHAVHTQEIEIGNDPADSIYTSEIGECFRALSKHVRRLVGSTAELALPENFNCA
jgi:hypothetical protein